MCERACACERQRVGPDPSSFRPASRRQKRRPSRLARVKRRSKDPDLQLKDLVGGLRRGEEAAEGTSRTGLKASFVVASVKTDLVASSDWIIIGELRQKISLA